MFGILQRLGKFREIEEICKRILKRGEDNVVRGFSLTEGKDERSKIEDERKKNKMKERGKLRILGSCVEKPNEGSDHERLKSDCELVEWKVEDKHSKFRAEVQKTQNLMGRTDILAMEDHLDTFQHIYRYWNQEADRLTHVAREKEATWNSFMIGGEGIF